MRQVSLASSANRTSLGGSTAHVASGRLALTPELPATSPGRLSPRQKTITRAATSHPDLRRWKSHGSDIEDMLSHLDLPPAGKGLGSTVPPPRSDVADAPARRSVLPASRSP